MAQEEFWAGRRVFLSGHTGFKGSWLSLWLQTLGAKVTGYALAPPTRPSLFEIAGVSNGMRSVIDDVRHGEVLTNVLVESDPEVVFHLAAQALVQHSYGHPVETYETNVLGTVNLLEAVRRCPGVRAVVVVTTDKCYDNREWVWPYREIDAMGGHDPYSSSKACAELVVAGYRSSFFGTGAAGQHPAAVASARAGNVIGGGDWAAQRLVPDIVRAVSAGQPVQVRNPNAVRPWQHVLDPLNGYLALAEHLWEHGKVFAEAWNFGPEGADVHDVRWVVDQFTQLWGDGARWATDDRVYPHEAHCLRLDCSKARARLGWLPKFGLQEALEWTVEWYRGDVANSPMRELSVEHIRRFSATEARA